ncbi:MAG TPA: antitoxin VapB family protein [Nitrososphaeraceae archaeon]|nr:antitoxin VapB family protein [Nitrososphaeraceae archaeon]
MQKFKHIAVNQEVYQKLKNLGKAGDSFNDVLVKLLQIIENKKQEAKQIVTI